MVIRTRVTLGCNETPHFVKEEFFQSVKDVTRLYCISEYKAPDTIRYHIPGHFVIGSQAEVYNQFMIDLDDETLTPQCHRSKTLARLKFKRRTPHAAFSRINVITEKIVHTYFLVLPNARFHHTVVYKNWECFVIFFNDMMWEIDFRQVYVDPHDLNHNIWFFSKPKYQIELRTDQDFRNREQELKQAIHMIIPRAFRWE